LEFRRNFYADKADFNTKKASGGGKYAARDDKV